MAWRAVTEGERRSGVTVTYKCVGRRLTETGTGFSPNYCSGQAIVLVRAVLCGDKACCSGSVLPVKQGMLGLVVPYMHRASELVLDHQHEASMYRYLSPSRVWQVLLPLLSIVNVSFPS